MPYLHVSFGSSSLFLLPCPKSAFLRNSHTNEEGESQKLEINQSANQENIIGTASHC